MSNQQPIPPNSKGIPAAETVKAFWEASAKPSSKSIEAAMRAQGYETSASTILRLVRSGFIPRPGKPKSTKAAKSTPEINAIKQVQAVSPGDAPPDMVAAAMVEHLRDLPEADKDRLKELVNMTDADLEKNGGKLVKVARYLLAEGIAKRPNLMLLMPDKTAKLLVVLDASAPVAPVAPIVPVNAGDNAKVIEHNPQEPAPLSPSAQAIRDFRAKRASAAA